MIYLQAKEYKEEKKEEKDLMEKIKTKMDQIRQNQQRKHVYKPRNHYQGNFLKLLTKFCIIKLILTIINITSNFLLLTLFI